MFEVQMKQGEKTTFLKVLHTGKESGMIKEIRYKQILKECYQLQKEMVYRYNYNRSTCIKLNTYTLIVNSIWFVLDHAIANSVVPLQLLNEQSIAQIYINGKRIVDELHKTLKNLAQDTYKTRIASNNERYLSILDEQLPSFIEAYDASYNACTYMYDYDYPLLDGLALYHHMYKLKGIDMVLEYMRRFSLEQDFFNRFDQEEIRTLFYCYEVQMGVEMTYLGINLCELVLIQKLCTYVIGNCTSLVFDEEQVAYFAKRINVIGNCTYVTAYAFSMLEKEIENHTMFAHLVCYKPYFLQKIEIASICGTFQNLLIMKYNQEERASFQMHPSCDPSIYTTLLTNLEDLRTPSERIERILATSLGFYDYYDLLESNILFEDELTLLFEKMDVIQKACLFYYRNQELMAFHSELSVLYCCEQWSTQFLWEEVLKHALEQMGEDQKQVFIQHLYLVKSAIKTI